VRKIIVCIARGEYLIAVVLNLMTYGPSGEFDPFYVERIKSTLMMFYEEEFSKAIQNDFNTQTISTPFHAFSN
jgi:hypothetical protein